MPYPQREIICYPITSISRPIDLFGAFPKAPQTFVPANPPAPPNRNSSKDNSTLKIFSQIHRVSKDDRPITSGGTIAFQKSRLPCSIRSKSAGSLNSSVTTLKEEKNLANSSRITRSYTHRVSSVSPVNRKIESRKSSASPIAFGRSISKERMFAEEKKKAEQNLPPCRKSVAITTSILRNPFVTPDEVRQAVRSNYRSPSAVDRITATKTVKRLTNSGSSVVRSSSTTLATNRTCKAAPKDDGKSVHVAVTSGTAAKPILSKFRSGPRIVTPIVIKPARASRSTETKGSRLKYTSKNSSNVSLARTSSTYSIDSTNSKKKSTARPITITRSVSRTRDYTATIPATITGKSKKKKSDKTTVSKKKSETTSYSHRNSNGTDQFNYTSSLRDEFQESINECIVDRNHSLGSDHFFQNLFCRDLSPDQVQSLNYGPPRTSVQQKALLWDTWPKQKQTPPSSSTASTRAPNVYLSQKRAVSGSKFKTMENERLRQSRSLSPQRIIRGPKCVYYDHVSKYEEQLTDDEPDCDVEATSLNYRYEERSRSEPRSRTYLHEIRNENGISTICGSTHKERSDKPERPFTPTKEIRSPSCRRIQSFKQSRPAPRSHSLHTPNRYHSLDSRLRSRSACPVDNEKYESHAELCSHQRAEKFKDLNRFYSNVERVGQLERATSSTDVRPIRREDELIDFDVWKQVRGHERAERELNSLVGHLKKEEKEKDFLFRPKYAEDLKWDQRCDRGLRIKEKSVENLKEIFIEKANQNELDIQKREHIEASKDTYKPLWRGNSVVDLASSMVTKYNPKITRTTSLKEGPERRLGLSTKLISTLSKEQVSKIKNQLSEIYCNKTGQKHEEFIINVTEEHTTTAPSSLIVRSNSLVNENELLKPVLRRQQARLQNNIKAESIGAVHEARVSRSVERYESKTKQPPLTEDEKKKLLQQLGQEIRDKLQERRDKVLQPKETRGAIAAETAALPPSKDPIPTKTVQFVDKNHVNLLTPHARITIEAKLEAKLKKPARSSKINRSEPVSLITLTDEPATSEPAKGNSAESDTVDHVKEKIVYFEKKRDEEPEKTVYHAREDSSPDEDEVMRVVEENIKVRQQENKRTKERVPLQSQGRSSSVTDFKEIFGEKEVARNLIEFRTPSPERRTIGRSQTQSPKPCASNSTSVESVFRSRSISPIVYDARNFRPHWQHIPNNTGEVLKIKNKFESLTYRPARYNAVAFFPTRRIHSDPDLNKVTRHISPTKVLVKDHESGDVSWITHKFETKNSASRSRSRDRKVISPIQKVPLRKDDRLMPHIDIISKTASLKQEINRKSPTRHLPTVTHGEVEKIRNKFESLSPDRLSLIGQMYTSSPDIRELKDITNHLTASWVAHKYPKPRDNARSPTSPETGPEDETVKKKSVYRPSSTSPPRSRDFSSILKPLYDVFSDNDYDPKKHRPTHRYTPDKKNIAAEYLWRRIKRAASLKPSVKFQGLAIQFFALLRAQCEFI